MNLIIPIPPVFYTFVRDLPTNIVVTPLNNAQPWQLFHFRFGWIQ